VVFATIYPGFSTNRSGSGTYHSTLVISEYSSCPEGHYDPVFGATDEDYRTSEYSSCPEGHYDVGSGKSSMVGISIGILLLPGRALRHSSWRHGACTGSCIGILLLPGRALRRSASPSGVVMSIIGILLLPGRALRRRPAGRDGLPCGIGILLLPGRALRPSVANSCKRLLVHRNTPPARKGITTMCSKCEQEFPATSEYSSCPEGHYDARIAIPRSVRATSEYSSCPEGHYDAKKRPTPRLDLTVSEYSSCPEGHYDSCTRSLSSYPRVIGILLLPGRALRQLIAAHCRPLQLIGILLLPGRALRRYDVRLCQINTRIGILLLPGRALRRLEGTDCIHHIVNHLSEYSSCPEGHYDRRRRRTYSAPILEAHIGILLLPGRALRLIGAYRTPAIVFIGILLLPGRALRRISSPASVSTNSPHRNTPPARKGITTERHPLRSRRSGCIGILLLPGRALRQAVDGLAVEGGLDRNTPPARKGITTEPD